MEIHTSKLLRPEISTPGEGFHMELQHRRMRGRCQRGPQRLADAPTLQDNVTGFVLLKAEAVHSGGLIGKRFLIWLLPGFNEILTRLKTEKKGLMIIYSHPGVWEAGREGESVNTGTGQTNCWRSCSVQWITSPEWEFQLNWTLFCMIAHDNCVLIGSTGDGV